MNRILLIIGGLLVGILAAAFIAPRFIDWTRYRGTFEEQASRALGREVRVGGDVSLRLLPTPFVRFEKLRIADNQGSVGEPLFKADDLTIWLSAGGLLAGRVEATDIEIRKPVLTLVMDDRGTGNWATLSSITSGSALPGNVKLDSVRVTNGAILVFGPGGAERTRLDRINGEVSAEALSGPWKVVGAFASHGAMREIRLSTAPMQPDGVFRVKGTVRAPESGVSVTLDGQVADILGKASVSGELTARLPVPAIEIASLPGGKPAKPKGPADNVIDLKSPVRADTAGLDLSDMQLSFEQDGRPQLASGTAKVTWRTVTDARIELESRWLDLDRMSGADGSTPPLTILNRLAAAIGDGVPSGGTTTVKLDADQMTLGGDAVGKVQIEIERADAGLGLRSLSASAPGGARIEARGAVTGGDGAAAAFNGSVAIRGASLARFLNWATKTPAAFGQIRRDGPFSVTGEIGLDKTGVRGRKLVMQLAGSSLAGDVSYKSGPAPELALSLEGTDIDVTPLLDGASGPVAAVKALAKKVESVAAPQQDGLLPAKMTLALRVGKLIAGNSTTRDVVTDIRFEGGRLTMPLVRVGGEDDWTLEVRGDIDKLFQTDARGRLTGVVEARTPQALASLSAFLDLPEPLRPGEGRAAHMLPLSMAVSSTLGDQKGSQNDIAFDGTVGRTRVAGSVRLDAAGKSWRDHGLDAALTLEGSEAANVMRLLLPQWTPGRLSETRSLTRLTLRGIGNAGGLATIAGIESGESTAEFRGNLAIGDTGSVGVSGNLQVETKNAGGLLTLAGFRSRPVLEGVPVAGAAKITFGDGKVGFDNLALSLANAGKIAGRLTLIPAASGGWQLDASLTAGRLSLQTMLAMLTEGRGTARAAAAGLPQSVWSDDPFDVAIISGLVGKLRVDADVLEIARGVEAKRARLDVVRGKFGWAAKLSEAQALGGRIGADFTLEAAASGLRLQGDVRLTDGRLEAAATGGPAVSGPVAFAVRLDGTALTPRGLIAALKGKGEISVGEMTLHRFAPASLRSVAETLVATKGELPAGEIRRRLEHVATAPQPAFVIPWRKVPLDVGDSLVRVGAIGAEMPEGRIQGSTTIDIDAMRIDSEWRIDTRAQAAAQTPGQPRGKGEFAPLTVVFAGPIADAIKAAPRVDAEQLEQDIVVRKVERDVEELERLRREDDQRARQEAERQRALEVERQLQQQQAPLPEWKTGVDRSDLPAASSPPAAANPSVMVTAPARPPRPAGSPASTEMPSTVGQTPPAELVQPPVPAPRPASRPKRQPPFLDDATGRP